MHTIFFEFKQVYYFVYRGKCKTTICAYVQYVRFNSIITIIRLCKGNCNGGVCSDLSDTFSILKLLALCHDDTSKVILYSSNRIETKTIPSNYPLCFIIALIVQSSLLL